MDDTKAPPQAIPEPDSKPAASPEDDGPSKRLKTNEGSAVVASTSSKKKNDEVIDVAAQLNFIPGTTKIEVKWTINDDDDSEEGGTGSGEKENVALDGVKADNGSTGQQQPAQQEEESAGKSVQVWWPATLCARTDQMHVLTDEEREESDVANDAGVNLPIYNLNYSPLKEFGFETHSMEEVAFISDRTLLNLSTDEIMIFRKEGEKSPPASPTIPEEEEEVNETTITTTTTTAAKGGEGGSIVVQPATTTTATTAVVPEDGSKIIKEFSGDDEMGKFMNTLMERAMKATGMDEKMKSLPASEQLNMAERIRRAKDGMMDKLKEETGKMKSGEKVITADVVKRCMAKMDGGY